MTKNFSQRSTRIDEHPAMPDDPEDHAVTRGRDESLRCEGGHSPEYHTVCWRTPTSSRYKEPLRPYHTDNRTRCCKLPSRGSVDGTLKNTAHTAQHSLFTSAERILRAWLKNCIFVRLKRVCHLVRTCLTLCCSLTCRSPRAHLLPHSLFLQPRHQNTRYNRDNTIYSKNTQYIINLSKTSQSTSGAIKNHSGVKPCRVAETRAKHSPQVMSQRACDCIKDLEDNRSTSVF